MKGTAGGTVFQFGACKDSQTAQDTNRMSGSAFTGAHILIDATQWSEVNELLASTEASP